MFPGCFTNGTVKWDTYGPRCALWVAVECGGSFTWYRVPCPWYLCAWPGNLTVAVRGVVLSKKIQQAIWFWDHSAAACGHLELSLWQIKGGCVIISRSTSHCFSKHKLSLTKDGFLSLPLKIILYDFLVWRFFYMNPKYKTEMLLSSLSTHTKSANIEETVFVLWLWWVQWERNWDK